MQMMHAANGQQATKPNKIVPGMVALLMAIGLAGLILLAVLAGKKHLEF